ncbi:MAG: diguanylate cyclase [Planctomycetes bacterium]|nr:diguanylate cyclase [Planctomycetota bacterium]
MVRQAREIYVLSADESLQREVAKRLSGGGSVRSRASAGEALAELQVAGREGKSCLIVLDEALPGGNAFALCRKLRTSGKHRIAMLLRSEAALSGPIATFCGAGLALAYPQGLDDLMSEIAGESTAVPLDELLRRGESGGEDAIRAGVLKDLESLSSGGGLLDAITDPETKLFNYPFLLFKLDEEFKRSARFKFPLSCVVFGFEGEASESVLLELAGIFLNESRDTDVLGRFDLNSFLFLLPNTGPDGARAMAQRVHAAASQRPLRDLAGDRLQISVGVSTAPSEQIQKREHLFEQARRAFLAARDAGGGIRVG